MKIEIENLKAKMSGARLNIYQKADAKKEFNRLLDYVNELEQLTIPVVVVNEANWCTKCQKPVRIINNTLQLLCECESSEMEVLQK